MLETVDRCKGSWKVSNPANAGAFSATAFNFAMMMNRVLDIPVGIINCSWGGSTVEGWLPRDIVSQYKDINLKKDIRKEDGHDWWHYMSPTLVGKRLAYMALSRTYGFKGMEDIGPVYKSMEVKDGAAILSFDHAKDGFNRLKGMEGFEIAGDDKVFYPAEAEVYNNLQIKVKSDKVKNPVAVRYCFRDFKPGNVANLRELPMYPFRTDNWE